MSTTPLLINITLLALTTVSCRVLFDLVMLWRAPVLDLTAWGRIRRTAKRLALLHLAVIVVDVFTHAAAAPLVLGSSALVGCAYIQSRRFRRRLYLQHRNTWESHMRELMALPDAQHHD